MLLSFLILSDPRTDIPLHHVMVSNLILTFLLVRQASQGTHSRRQQGAEGWSTRLQLEGMPAWPPGATPRQA